VIGLGGFISFLLALLVGLSETLDPKGMYFTMFTFGLSGMFDILSVVGSK
jgi:hypothetical protein